MMTKAEGKQKAKKEKSRVSLSQVSIEDANKKKKLVTLAAVPG
jgi:hypothetical protein